VIAVTAYDYLIVGSGAAGLSAALAALAHGRTLLLTKDAVQEANTHYAQGGIAAALSEDDSPAAHLHDTLAAGAGLVDEPTASIMTDGSLACVEALTRLGMPFDRIEDGRIALGREAAHSACRIVHAGGDATGAHLEQTLSERIAASSVELQEHTLVTRIVLERRRTGASDGLQTACEPWVAGVEALDCKTGTRRQIGCRHLILASGGAGQLYRYTTNPPVATGDGIALAYRAGAEVMDLEFIQFHPTALRLPGAPTFLISEAVRGEGAVLRDRDGRAFMARYDARAELAPRDIVARAIHSQMALTGTDHVYLDLTHLPAERVRSRFPQIDAFCRRHGLDLTRDLLPVAPAAHYTIGGVRTNAWGETNVRGLFACGEVACTGVHGANRLASNSLLEALVFGRRVVERTLNDAAPPQADPAISLARPLAGEACAPSLADLQALMWDRASIVRERGGLEQARLALSAWAAALPTPTDRPSHELANLVLVGRLVVEAAWRRRESRGAHYRADFPEPSPSWRRHLVFAEPEAATR
jgi:L-aspartate oxidase